MQGRFFPLLLLVSLGFVAFVGASASGLRKIRACADAALRGFATLPLL